VVWLRAVEGLAIAFFAVLQNHWPFRKRTVNSGDRQSEAGAGFISLESMNISSETVLTTGKWWCASTLRASTFPEVSGARSERPQ
jgi:hypothetical protein